MVSEGGTSVALIKFLSDSGNFFHTAIIRKSKRFGQAAVSPFIPVAVLTYACYTGVVFIPFYVNAPLACWFLRLCKTA